LNDVFDAMWPQLEKQLAGLPSAGTVVAPERSAEDMIAEVLELSRDGTRMVQVVRGLEIVVGGLAKNVGQLVAVVSRAADRAWSGEPPGKGYHSPGSEVGGEYPAPALPGLAGSTFVVPDVEDPEVAAARWYAYEKRRENARAGLTKKKESEGDKGKK
jgi:hypothetical protein